MKIQRCLQQQGQDTHSAMMPDYIPLNLIRNAGALRDAFPRRAWER